MPDDANLSPAVESMRKEQAEQKRRKTSGRLQLGLEQSFPASDPVSVTRSSIPTGRVDQEEAAKVCDEPDYGSASTDRGDQGEIDALRKEVSRLSQSLTEIGARSARLAKAEGRSLLADVEGRIRQRPLAAVGLVALIAYVWGASR